MSHFRPLLITVIHTGISERFASSNGPFDSHLNPLRERRSPADPRQVADPQGLRVVVAGQHSDRREPSEHRELLGPLPDMRSGVRPRAGHILPKDTVPVQQVQHSGQWRSYLSEYGCK